MRVTIEKSAVAGKVMAPPSKSMAHRLLLCAAFAEGKSVIHGVSACDDVAATIECLQTMGVPVEQVGDTVTVTGVDFRRARPAGPLFCRESGSTLRFMVPPCLLGGSNCVLTGCPSLMRRPMSVYEKLASERGFIFSQDDNSVIVRGPLSAGDYRLAGNVSSQFVSGLLFALPQVEGDSTITLIPPVESRSYIELTVDALDCFGVKVTWKDEHTLQIRGGQRFSPTETTVEGDYSGAAFFAALQTLGGDLQVDGLRADSLQGDRVYTRYFDMLAKGTPTIHIGDCPDLGPVLFAVAAAKYGGVFTGTARLRLKESDRGTVMAEELKKFGVAVTVHEDAIVVYPMRFHAPTEPLCGHNDHRIVMSLAVLATLTGATIQGAEAVSKSFPGFFRDLQSIGVRLQISET